MADTILSVAQIENLFWALTLQMLGLDPTDPNNQSRVRIEWPKNGYPGWKIDEDIAFLMVNFDDDAITRQKETVYQYQDSQYASFSQSETRVLRINWTFYGPNSFNDASTVRSMLSIKQFLLNGETIYLQDILKTNNLALILDVPSPVRSPELFNGQWWDRASFYARFNELVVRTSTIPYLQSADIQVIPNE